MALTWNVTNVKDYEINFPDVVGKDGSGNDERQWNPVTTALVTASMVCGFREITEANVDDVFMRIRIFEEVAGEFRHQNREPVKFKLDEVRGHIGLTTNVSNESKAKFNGKMMSSLWRQALQELVSEKERLVKG